MPKYDVGIDVAAKTLEVRVGRPCGEEDTFELLNEPKDHQKLIKQLTQSRSQARVVLEASGVYHLDLALALHQAARIEVMVVNPRAARDFAKAAMQRSKTDRLDAAVLLEFARRMRFQAWSPPVQKSLSCVRWPEGW